MYLHTWCPCIQVDRHSKRTRHSTNMCRHVYKDSPYIAVFKQWREEKRSAKWKVEIELNPWQMFAARWPLTLPSVASNCSLAHHRHQDIHSCTHYHDRCNAVLLDMIFLCTNLPIHMESNGGNRKRIKVLLSGYRINGIFSCGFFFLIVLTLIWQREPVKPFVQWHS